MKYLYRQLLLILVVAAGGISAQAQDLDFIIGDACGDVGDVIDVDVTSRDYTDIVTYQILIGWDTLDLQLVDVVNITSSLPNEFLDITTPNETGLRGQLRSIFQEFGAPSAYTLPPSEVLFTMRMRVLTAQSVFSRIGDLPGVQPTNFAQRREMGGDVSFAPDIIQSNAELNMNGDCGGGGGGTDDLIIRAEHAEAGLGEQVCMQVVGENMMDLQAIQNMAVLFDTSELEYVSIASLTLPQANVLVNPTQLPQGRLIVNWGPFIQGNNGLSGDAPLFEICFNVKGDCEESASVTLMEQPGQGVFGIFDIDGDVTDYTLESGSITVSCCNATPTITDVSCFGEADGAISLSPIGCMDIVSYTWSNGDNGQSITGLEAASYDVTITYNNGSSDRIITGIVVGQSSDAVSITVDTVGKVTTGSNGFINVSVVGGVQPYDYAWSSGQNTQDINGLAMGNYTLTVTDDNDCSAIVGPIQVAGAPNVSGQVQNVQCFGTATGGVNLTVTGGAAPYTYNWSCSGSVDPATGSISGLAGGNCTVTVTDASGCDVIQNFTIQTPSSPIQVTSSVTDDLMSDGSGAIDLTVSGGWGGYSYQWSDGFATDYPDVEDLEGIFGGDYTVTITDANGCEVVEGSFEVEGLNVVVVAFTPTTCFGDDDGAIDILALNGSGFYSYSWSCDGAVDQDGNISGLEAGPCTVTVTDQQTNNTVIRTFNVPGAIAPLSVSFTSSCANAVDGSLLAEVTGGQAPYDFLWNTTPAQTGAEAIGLEAGAYTVEVTDSFGCEVLAMANVIDCAASDCFIAMDAITPNGDGANDRLIISCAADVNNELSIFTRWGEEVNTYTNYTNQWNGVDRGGNRVDEGTYFWVLEVNRAGQRAEIYKGTVLVLYELR